MRPYVRSAALFLSIIVLSGCGDSVTDPVSENFQNCGVAPYQLGSTVSGSLTSSDCLLNYQGFQGGEYVDFYGFSIGSSRAVTINMTSNQIDSYLIIWNRATGAIVAEDDDGSTGVNARINITLPAGSYVIGATSFDAGEIGPYTLSSN
jgi:hypothetical protein